MPGLRVLFLGGTGIISSACSRLAVERGIELFVLNRGRSAGRPLPPEVTLLRGDARDPASVRDALGGREFDAVVDWVAFTPDHVRPTSARSAAGPGNTCSSARRRRIRRRRPGCR